MSNVTGWYRPSNRHRFHYFVDGGALCGKSLDPVDSSVYTQSPTDRPPENCCKDCDVKRWIREEEAKGMIVTQIAPGRNFASHDPRND